MLPILDSASGVRLEIARISHKKKDEFQGRKFFVFWEKLLTLANTDFSVARGMVRKARKPEFG